jgi:hypothetical protein
MAKLDRLSHYVHFLTGERGMTPKRTKEALAAAKARSAGAGNPSGATAFRRAGIVAAVRINADRRASDLADVVAAVRANGASSLYAVAEELNRRCIKTARERALPRGDGEEVGEEIQCFEMTVRTVICMSWAAAVSAADYEGKDGWANWC